MRKTQNTLTKFERVAPIVLFIVVGLALRLWFLSVNELNPAQSPADDGDYYQRALRFATTGYYIDDFWLIRPPLHVFLFALMLRVSILLGNVPGLALVRGAQIVLSLLAIPAGYGLARRLFGHRAGLVFAGILAVWYPLIELPSHLFTEPLFITLLLVHLWLLVYWRDEQRWMLLALAGVFLGLAALTRSVAVYGVPFVLLWLVLEAFKGHYAEALKLRGDVLRARLPVLGRWVCMFALPCVLTILPWTVRNALVHERFILIDTIGTVNLWLHVEKYENLGYDQTGVEMLREMPQRDRHVFAIKDTRRMFFEDPVEFWGLLWRNAWEHFLHIWKGQFVEDFFLKSSFYGRPLREMWVPGMVGEVLWLGFALGGLAALAAPFRDGLFRSVALCWVAYTMLTVMIFHLEPRYLMPLWLVLALYSAWPLGNMATFVQSLRQQPTHGVLVLLVMIAFVVLCVTYRNYPETIAAGMQRETSRAAGMRAYAAGEYDEAIGAFETMLAADDHFVSSRAELGMALIAAGRYAEAERLLGEDDAQHMLVARGMLALARGEDEQAATLLTKAEKKSGNDVQVMTMHWFHPKPTTYLELGSGLDYGYIEGFSLAENTHPPLSRSYRWVQGKGHIVMPLPQALQPGSVVALRMAGGQAANARHMSLDFVDMGGNIVYTAQIQLVPEQWRIYRVAVPDALVGQHDVRLVMQAPVFIPAHFHRGNSDIRPVSLMLNAVWVGVSEK